MFTNKSNYALEQAHPLAFESIVLNRKLVDLLTLDIFKARLLFSEIYMNFISFFMI